MSLLAAGQSNILADRCRQPHLRQASGPSLRPRFAAVAAGIGAHLRPRLNGSYGVSAANFNAPPDPAGPILHGKMASFGDPPRR
jgi:hypothetical protein